MNRVNDIKKKRESILVAVQGITMMILPLVWVFTPFLDIFDAGFPIWLRFVGIGLLVASMYLFYVVHRTLGKNWSPVLDMHEDHELICEGVYKHIRHPMYTQIWMWVFGTLITCSNWLLGSVSIVAWAVLYFLRVPDEERMMEEQFGEEYQDYKKRTGRLLPRVISKVK
jgi:protein-S-isoprenylcysteine O-methyltransferase Ste14